MSEHLRAQTSLSDLIRSLICAVLLRALIIRPVQSLLKKLPGLRLTQQENKTT